MNQDKEHSVVPALSCDYHGTTGSIGLGKERREREGIVGHVVIDGKANTHVEMHVEFSFKDHPGPIAESHNHRN